MKKGKYYFMDFNHDHANIVYAASKADAIKALESEWEHEYTPADLTETSAGGFGIPAHCSAKLYVSRTPDSMPSKAVMAEIEGHRRGGQIIWCHN